MGTGKWRDRWIAWSVVLAWHAGVLWWLLHALPVAIAPNDIALQVVYVSLVPPRSASATRAPPRRASAATNARQSGRRARQSAPAIAATISAGPKPLLLPALAVQVQEQAARQAPIDFSPRDPFADRPSPLPTGHRDRFRMQPRRSLQAMVATVGGYLLAPRGYDPDPCPRHRDNIGNLMAAGDSTALRQELDLERRHCR